MKTHRLTRHGLGTLCAVALTAGCAGDAAGPSSPVAPTVLSSSVASNPHNVISAIVSASVRDADSVAVRFRVIDGGSGSDSVTPAVIAEASEDSVIVPVLGLLPSTRYSLAAVAYGNGSASTGQPLELTTQALPADVPRYTAGGSSPSPGFVVFAFGVYGLVIDNTGRVVWYRRFPEGIGLSFAPQPNGRYTARLVTPLPNDIESWIEIDPLGRVARTLGCTGRLQPRFHDLIVEQNGDYWIMCDEVRTMDLSDVGGVGNAIVTGTAVQHIADDGLPLFHWSPFDHFAITDVDLRERTDRIVNWTHGNSLDIDTDGNLLVSFRNLNEITKIDVPSGRVLWRLGGLRNQFTIVDSPMPAFAQQHSVRTVGRGALVLLDNVGNPTESEAERYELDDRAMTARLVRAYAAVPRVVTQIGGSTQPLPGGRTLVSFGTAGRVEEYDATGNVVWRIQGNAGYVFRAVRIQSLCSPVPTR